MDMQLISTILDIVFLVLLVLGCLIGFCRGIFKSTYNFLVFLGLLITGWLISGLFVNILLDTNINITIEGIYISSLRQSLPDIVSEIDNDLGALMVEGTEAYTLVLQLIKMVAKFIFICVWLLLMFTVLKFVFWIIYLIVRPRRKNEDGTKKKKKFTSRLGGALVGTVHATLLILIFCVPISGICSIGSEVTELSKQESVAYVVPTNDDKLVVLANENNNNIDDYFSFYRNSSLGKFYGSFKLGGTSIDEKIFDDVFSFKYNSEKVRLKSELTTVVNVYNKLNNEIDGEITLESIMNLESETLYEIIDDISDLKLISVAIPVAAEYAINSESFKKEYGDLLGEIDSEKLLDDLKNVNYHDDFANLGKGLIDISKSGLLTAINGMGSSTENISLFTILDAIDEEEFTKACEKISEVGLLDIVGDFGINYLLNSKEVAKYLEKANLSIEDINLDDVKLSNEIGSLCKVILSIKELNLSSEKDIDISKLDEEKINALVEALYGVEIFNKNTQLVVSVVREELLPKEYRDILPDGEMTCDDLKSVVKVAKVMLDSENTSIENGTIDISALLSQENIEMLKNEAKNSEFLTSVVDGAGQILIDTICDTFNISKENINLDGVSWVDELDAFKDLLDVCSELGIDFNKISSVEIKFEEITDKQIEDFASAVFESKVMKNNTELILSIIKSYAGKNLENYIPKTLSNKEELVSFVKLARTMVKSSSGETIDISAIDKDELEDALNGLSSENIDNLLTGIVEGTGIVSKENINLPTIDPSTEEGKEEIKKTLEAMEVLSDIEDITSIKQLRDEQISAITSSSVATSIIVSVLEEQNQEGGALNGFLALDGIDAEDWVDSENGDGELKKLIAATEILLDDNGNANFTTSTITDLSDSDIEKLTDSKVVINSLEKAIGGVIEETINSSFDTSELGIEINLGNVTAETEEEKKEAWQKEIEIIRDVTSMAEGINPETTDLSDKETAEKVGNLIESCKDSQILGETSVSLASAILENAYADIDGYDAPEVDENTDFVQEFAKLQALLSK